MIGKSISYYQVLCRLGEGGMGIVYKAEDIRLRRCVTLKFLSPAIIADAGAKERFIQEAQTASSLRCAPSYDRLRSLLIFSALLRRMNLDM